MVTHSTDNDKKLRANIQLLRRISAQVLKTQSTSKVAGIVDSLQRQFAALQRNGSVNRREQMMNSLRNLTPGTLTEVIRAFSMYFSLLNIAEEFSSLHARRRQADENGQDSSAMQPLLRTINAIAAGMRNTGQLISF